MSPPAAQQMQMVCAGGHLRSVRRHSSVEREAAQNDVDYFYCSDYCTVTSTSTGNVRGGS